jgi:predicted enzyme related to lactoylglutathione lyase
MAETQTAKQQIVWFDIPVTELDRAIRFYGGVLDVKISREAFEKSAMGILPHGDGVTGGCLYVDEKIKPGANGPLLYFNCGGRLDQAVAAVEKLGGKVLQAKHQIGPHGFRAVVLDSEGNRIALHSM